MPIEVSVRLRYLHQDKGTKICEFLKMKEFSCYSESNVYLHAKLPIRSTKKDLRNDNKGRPHLLNDRDKRSIVKTEGVFSVKRLRLEAGIDDKFQTALCDVVYLNELG